MYTNINKDIVQDNTPYIGLDGIKYPATFPKSEIAELSLVTLTPQPTTNDIITGFHIDATNTQVWDTKVKTPEELAQDAQISIDQMRGQRDIFLQDSDYTQLQNTALTTAQVTAYASYRQELRDLPALYPDGLNIIWPTKPV